MVDNEQNKGTKMQIENVLTAIEEMTPDQLTLTLKKIHQVLDVSLEQAEEFFATDEEATEELKTIKLDREAATKAVTLLANLFNEYEG
jgi:RecB family endonuclease NucS